MECLCKALLKHGQENPRISPRFCSRQVTPLSLRTACTGWTKPDAGLLSCRQQIARGGYAPKSEHDGPRAGQQQSEVVCFPPRCAEIGFATAAAADGAFSPGQQGLLQHSSRSACQRHRRQYSAGHGRSASQSRARCLPSFGNEALLLHFQLCGALKKLCYLGDQLPQLQAGSSVLPATCIAHGV